MINKKIYLEPTYKLHIGYHLRELIPFPPQGYEFIVNEGKSEGLAKWVSGYSFAYRLFTGISGIVPSVLLKAYLGLYTNKPPQDSRLTFSLNHLVFRKEPWVIEIDAPWDPIGPSVRYFNVFKTVMEHAFISEYCKKVFCACEFSRKTLFSLVDCSKFKSKVDILPRAVSSKQFTKKLVEDKVKLFFLGSANLSGAFEMRGGKEVLEAFAVLSRRYNNIELIIRSDISHQTRDRYKECLQLKNVKLVDKSLPFSDLEEIYKSSDIFLIPAHFADWLVMMEAMSYELPVVAVDVYAASEYLDDGKTGFLVKSSKEVLYFDHGIPLLNMTSKFQKSIQNVDLNVVSEIVEKTSLLIENKTMRQAMGKAGRWEIEHGKFSIERRNEVFKRVFDEIVGI